MPPKKNMQRNRGGRIPEDDQPPMEQTRAFVQPPRESQTGRAEGHFDQPWSGGDQPRSGAPYRDEPRRDQPRSGEQYRDQTRSGGPYRDEPKRSVPYKDQARRVEPQYFQQKSTEPQNPSPRDFEGSGKPKGEFQSKGSRVYGERGQQSQYGPQQISGAQQQQPRQGEEFMGQQQPYSQSRDSFKQQQQPPPSQGQQQRRGQDYQPPQQQQQTQPIQRGHQRPAVGGPQQPRAEQEFIGKQQQYSQEGDPFKPRQPQGQQKAPAPYQFQTQTKGPESFPPQQTQSQPKGAEGFTSQQKFQAKAPEVHIPGTTQSQQRGPNAWKGTPQPDTTNIQQQPPPQMQQQPPPQMQQKELQKSIKDDVEQLQPKVSSLSLKPSDTPVKTPTGDTTKPKSDSPPEASSSSASEASAARALPKKMHTLKLNMKISQTMQQKFLPKRPDPGGKKGREIKLIINCLDMKIKPMKVYMYDIELKKAEVKAPNKNRDVLPKVQKKDELRKIVYGFLKDKGGLPVFDGSKIIFSNQMLPIDNNIVNKVEYKHMVDEEMVTCHFDLQRVKEQDIELSDLNYYVESGTGRSDNLPQEPLRALDTVIRDMFLNKNLISVNRRAIFDPKTSRPLRCGPYLLLEGYATTVRPHMWNIRFNFDKTQIVLHKPLNLYDYISELTQNFKFFRPDQVKKKIMLLRVEARHLKNAEGKPYTRKYTIHGFSRGNAKEEKIVEKNITIEQYFQQEYNIRLKYPQYPLIKTNPTKATFVPMEILTVLPHQRVLANDPQIVQEVIRAAAVPAFDRLKTLREAIKTLNLGNKADQYLKNYMIEIDDKLIDLVGRVLDGPEAQFGGGPEWLRGGKWDFRRKRFLKPHQGSVNWALFGVGTERDYQRDERLLYDIEEQLPGASGRVGITMAPMYTFQYITWQQIEIEIPRIIAKSEQDKKRLDLLVFVINRDEDYKAVKRFGDMIFGIATQCMKLGTLTRQNKGLDQYFGNIMLKINTKLGGINWELSSLIKSSFSPVKGRFMVFGIDVTHPGSTRNDLSKSVAAMVGSLDNTASLYSAVIRQQISKEERSIVEVVIDTEDMVHKLLMTFYRTNKTLKPDHLIFYRDGVSEGQFSIVFQHEIVAIQNACAKLQPDYQPKITYIVVQKRHKIRFFPATNAPQDAIGRSGNVPSGTVVDKNITHCREFDFYLCSHEGIQGTSKPAHYHVLYDENNWGSDDLQSFTYFLCHVYARATRSVSYPAPTYYAHLAAFRGRALIGEIFDDSASSASSQTKSAAETRETEIVIHDYHNNKLFFI